MAHRFSSLRAVQYFEQAAKSGNKAKLRDLYKDFGFSEERIAEIARKRSLSEFDKIQIADNAPALMNVTGETSMTRQPWMDKPLAKAGKSFHAYRSKAKRSKRTKGIAMNPVSHPHGGGGHPHVGTQSSPSYNAPPGRKVGRIASKPKRRKK